MRCNPEKLSGSGLERLAPGDRVAVALSGGVDSAATAWILKQRGLKVYAFHLIINRESESVEKARAAARVLELDLELVDLSREFDRLIAGPFARSYSTGETPSPCVECNPKIKFGLLLKLALARGLGFVATGHYTGLVSDQHCGPVLVRPRDRHKDQTYFLCRVPGDALRRAVFPLAGLTKDEVRQMAALAGFEAPAESQEICFLGGGDYRDFIISRLGPEVSRPGDFVDESGLRLGRHRGLINYTVGQRRGLNVPAEEPYYVLALDPAHNRIVLGTKDRTRRQTLWLRDVVLNARPTEDVFMADVQIRSRHKAARARVEIMGTTVARVTFDQPQESPAPGQAAALYDGDVLLGGGWIAQPESGPNEIKPR